MAETPLQHRRLVFLLARCISFVLGVVTARGHFNGNLRDCKVLQRPPYALGCVRVRPVQRSAVPRNDNVDILCRLVMGHTFIVYVSYSTTPAKGMFT